MLGSFIVQGLKYAAGAVASRVATDVAGEVYDTVTGKGSGGAASSVAAQGTGYYVTTDAPSGRRRRRRRLLTCSDRQDIAYLTATLGKGQLASSAIGSLLARRCS